MVTWMDRRELDLIRRQVKLSILIQERKIRKKMYITVIINFIGLL